MVTVPPNQTWQETSPVIVSTTRRVYLCGRVQKLTEREGNNTLTTLMLEV